MSISMGKKIIRKGQHRLFDRLNTILIIHEAIGIASLVRMGFPAEFDPGDATTIGCTVLPLEIAVPVHGLIDAALNNILPEKIEVEFLIRKGVGFEQPERPHPGTLRHLLPQAISPVFVEFYESISDWLFKQLKHQDNFPQALKFGRAVRIAISHGSKVSFTNKNEKTANWYGLSYDYSKNGREIFLHDLRIGDLVLLMFEMDDELDQLGCPL